MTVTLKLAEPIADAIVAKLQAGLAARIAAINAADTQGVTITEPAEYRIGSFGPIAPSQPAILITEAGRAGDDSFGEEGPHSFTHRTEMLVGVFELDTDPGQLRRKLWRQARAIIEVLWDDDPKEMLGSSAPFTARKIHPVRAIPGPTFDPTDTETRWSGVYGVVFVCDQQNG